MRRRIVRLSTAVTMWPRHRTRRSPGTRVYGNSRRMPTPTRNDGSPLVPVGAGARSRVRLRRPVQAFSTQHCAAPSSTVGATADVPRRGARDRREHRRRSVLATGSDTLVLIAVKLVVAIGVAVGGLVDHLAGR